ncbi:MAG: T9SS type A sorting domain-containing protein [Ignavibacteria bacterium]
MKKIYSDFRFLFIALLMVLFTFSFMLKPATADVVGVQKNATHLINVFADGTWTTISSNPLTLSGFTVSGATAVTWNSDDLQFYAVLNVGSPNRRLVTVIPSTGVCTDIGPMGQQFSSITYSSTTSTMYAMSGLETPTPSTLYSVNLLTGATTYLAGPFTLIADQGEVIAYNYDNGLMYHWAGFPDSSARMSTINLTTFVETEIIQSGASHSEISGAVYQGAGRFIATDLSNSAFTITSAGVVALQATLLPFQVKGLGYVDALLPVELTSFTSAISGGNVTLNWATASETNNSGFDIERSKSNQSWSKIATLTGNGTTILPSNYSFVDRNLNSGNYNYRLKQIDFNGNFEYFNLSNEVVIGIPSKFKLSQNYPNPFNPSTKINYDIPFDGKVSIVLFDVSGRELHSIVNEVKSAGYYTTEFNAAGLPSGVYFYRITSEGSGNKFTATRKMILLK